MVRSLLAVLILPLFWARHPRAGTAEKLGDDEFAIDFGDGPIGLDLTEVRFPAGVPAAKQSSRVIISSIRPGSQAERLGKPFRLRPQLLLVSVNGKNVEGMRAKDVIALVVAEKKESDEYEDAPLRLVFRDPLIFKEKLLNSESGAVVETQVGPLGSEKLVVNITKVPEQCGAIRTQQGDLIEVKYTGYLAGALHSLYPRRRRRPSGPRGVTPRVTPRATVTPRAGVTVTPRTVSLARGVTVARQCAVSQRAVSHSRAVSRAVSRLGVECWWPRRPNLRDSFPNLAGNKCLPTIPLGR